jgi:NAD(P)-dependent dehydrogenase (short-subunit alcohol dehydrogenase family)
MNAPRPSTLVIVTGASRGLGHAIAAQYLSEGAHVLGLSRHPSDDLAGTGAGAGVRTDRGAGATADEAARLEQWPVDLANPQPVAERLEAWLAQVASGGSPPARLRLIHNAALLSAPGALGDAASSDAAELAQSLRIGLEAPVVLTAGFLRATASWNACDRRVLFVSSGLGRRPMAGTATYCAQKAGLDHFARALALEEAARPQGARVASVAPGVIDSDMQRQLRGADLARFPERVRFDELQRSGALDSPAQAAAKVIARLERADFGEQPVTDVREG